MAHNALSIGLSSLPGLQTAWALRGGLACCNVLPDGLNRIIDRLFDNCHSSAR